MLLTINVDLAKNKDELLHALASELGIKDVMFPMSNTLWEYTSERFKMPLLVEYRDVSVNAIPNYEETGVTITDPKKLKAYKVLNELKSIL